MAGWTKTYTLDFTASGDTVYTGTDKLEDNEDAIITYLNLLKKSFASSTAPSSPAPDEGQFWWDSTNDIMYIYTGSTWTAVGVDTYKAKSDSADTAEGYLNAKVQKSITVNTTDHKMELSGDSASPGNNYVYGTDGSGTKGWQVSSNARILTIPASAFEIRDATGWADYVQVQGTNLDFGVLAFDKDTDEKTNSPQICFADYNAGNVTATILFRANATSGTVVWAIGINGIADNDAGDVAPTYYSFDAKTVGGTAYDWNIASLTFDPHAVISADEWTSIWIMRDVSEDNLAVDAQLMSVQIEYTRT